MWPGVDRAMVLAVVGLSPRQTRSDPRSVYVRHLRWTKLYWDRFFRTPLFSPVIIIRPMHHTQIYENSRIHLDRLQNKHTNYERIKNNTNSRQITEIQEDLDTTSMQNVSNRLHRIMKHYSSTGRRNYGRPLKRLLDTWDRNGSTSGPTPWQIDNDAPHSYFIHPPSKPQNLSNCQRRDSFSAHTTRSVLNLQGRCENLTCCKQ